MNEHNAALTVLVGCMEAIVDYCRGLDKPARVNFQFAQGKPTYHDVEDLMLTLNTPAGGAFFFRMGFHENIVQVLCERSVEEQASKEEVTKIEPAAPVAA